VDKRVRERDAVLERWTSGVIPRAVAYARSLLHSPQDAEDTVHDALCRILSHPEYDLAADGEKILFRAVTNACINRWQRKKKIVSLNFSKNNSRSILSALPSDRAPDPARTAMNREALAAVGRALAQLPQNQCAALELKSLGHSLKDIAEMLGVTPSNAGVLVHRARKALALRLGPLHVEY